MGLILEARSHFLFFHQKSVSQVVHPSSFPAFAVVITELLWEQIPQTAKLPGQTGQTSIQNPVR